MKTEESKRDIPPPPSGGSWTFDEAAWAWVSNDPAPAAEQDPPSDPAIAHNEVEQE